MIVDWGYRCLDCGVDMDDMDISWLTEAELVLVAQYYHHIFMFRSLDLSFARLDWECTAIPFLQDHYTHHITLLNSRNETKPIPPIATESEADDDV